MNANPYEVILYPGTDEARSLSRHRTAHEAYVASEDARDEHGAGSADVAKRLPDGSLTYEF